MRTGNSLVRLAQKLAGGMPFDQAVQESKPAGKGGAKWVQRQTRSHKDDPDTYREKIGVGELLAQKEAEAKRAQTALQDKLIDKFKLSGSINRHGRIELSIDSNIYVFRDLFREYVPKIYPGNNPSKPIFTIQLEDRNAIQAHFKACDHGHKGLEFYFQDINTDVDLKLNDNQGEFTIELSTENPTKFFEKLADCIEE